MPAPKHKPNATHKPILLVILPIVIPAIKPIPAPIDVLDYFILIRKCKYVFNCCFK